jgi:hypothetical protein
MFLLATFVPASAQNVLLNPGFEDGAPGAGASSWITFGNVYTEASNPPQFEPYAGNQLAAMFGPFDGSVVSGMFQEFPAAPGSRWAMSAKSRQWSGDALTGGAFVVQKIVFKDGGDVEIGAVESVILDAGSPTDTWLDNAPIIGEAPLGTVQVEGFILFIQPNFETGAGQFDNVMLAELTGCSDVHTTASGDGCAPSLLDGQDVTVSGIVYVPAGTYNSGSIYFQCAQGGNIFFESGGPYAMGDEILVTGTVGAFGDEIQLNGAMVQVISSGNTPVAHPIATGVLGAGGDFFADFLEVEGTLLSKDVSGFNDEYSIDDGTGVATIYLDGTTGIDESVLDANIGGVVRVSGATRCGGGGDPGQVLPRMDADIVIISPPPPPPTVACGSEVHGNGTGCAPSPLAGELVTTSGVVYVAAGTYNGGSVYYQCADGGLTFFLNGAPYAIGDEIKVVGAVGAFSDEIQLEGVTVEVLSTGNMATPQYLATGQLAAGGPFLGDFVELQGTLVAKTSSGFNDAYVLDDGTGPVVMFVDGTTGIDDDRVDSFVGRTVRVRGSTKCFNDEGEILPRFDSDIEAVSVAFDIKPGSCENPFNMRNQGVLPVAILGSEDLDVSLIDPASLRLEGVKAKMTAIEDVEDATGSACDEDCAPLPMDEYPDLVAKFANASVAEAIYGASIGEPIPLRLTGTFLDGRPFDGVDCVQIVGFVPEGGLDKGPDAPKFSPVSSPRAPVQQVSYTVTDDTRVRLQVFSITGRLLETVIDRTETAGDHLATWDASRYASGVYFYRYEAGDFKVTRKVLVVH